ncbi:MAG: tetratricopeptide repeat protein [Acidobacteria bacterium]|nr:tetratricopeptide repeat protein [Acidobacteriota bacterium]
MRWHTLAAVGSAALLASAIGSSAQAPPPASAQNPQRADLDRLKAAYDRDRADDKAALEYVAAAIRASQPELARPVLYQMLSRPEKRQPAQAAEAWFQIGHVHFRAGEYEEAIACWQTVVRDYRTSDRASGAAINLASVLLQVQGDTKGAGDVLDSRLRDGTIKGAHVELAHFLLFQVHVELKQYAEARGLLGSLPATGDRHALIQDVVPVVLWKTGDEARARRELEALFAAAEDNASALNNLAATLTDHGVAPDVAVACAARAVVVSGGTRHDIWDTYAEALFQSGQMQPAIEAEEKAVALATAQRDQTAYRARLDAYRAAARTPK